MNVEFLNSLGIQTRDPQEALEQLGRKEFELSTMRDGAETKGETELVSHFEEQLRQIEQEREALRRDAREAAIAQEKAAQETPGADDKKARKEQEQTRKESFEQWKQKRSQKLAQRQELSGAAAQQGTQGNASAPQNAQNQGGAGAAVQSGQGAAVQGSAPAAPQGAARNARGAAQQGKAVSSQSNAAAVQGKSVAAQAQPASASKDTKTASAPSAKPADPSQGILQSAASSDGGRSEYSKGLRLYQGGRFEEAFQSFLTAAESKDLKEQSKLQETALASYLLAKMYREGEGTKVDKSRGMHYLKRAADLGYDVAQVEYGMLVLSKHRSGTEEDEKARREGLKYIEMSADAGCVEGIKEFIRQAKESSDTNKKTINKAKRLIPIIKDKLDSYEAAKCDEWIRELDEREKAVRKKKSYPVKVVIGDLLFLIGMLYLLKGLHQEFFDEKIPGIIRFIPDIPDQLILKWERLKAWTEPYFSHQGIFGCWLIVLGRAIFHLGVNKCKGNFILRFKQVITVVAVVLCIGNFYCNIAGVGTFFGNGSYMQILAFVVSLLLGKIVGSIAYRIIK